MAARTTGKYSGRQPAITAFIAAFSIVQSTKFGGIDPSISSGLREVPANMRAIRKSVGAMMGRPSVHPLSKATSAGSSNSSTSIARDRKVKSPYLRANLSGMPGSIDFDPHPG